MTYSHNSVGNNNLKMTTTTATATTKSATRNGCGGAGNGNVVANNKHFNRRTPPNSLTTTTTPLSATSAILAFDNYDAVHSNSIACSTNMQQHPLMGGSPPNNNDFLSTPPTTTAAAGSYFGNQQRKQQRNNVNAQWKTPQTPISVATSLTTESPSSPCNGGGAFFSKNNYGGQYFNNNNSRRKSQKYQQHEQRTPTCAAQMSRSSPATVLGGGLSSSNICNADGIKTMPTTTSGRKRRPKMHLQSPIISLPRNLGVGGNISPTHPLLPAVLTHFAGSKFFDAPAPSAVPKPPEHWMPMNKEEEKTASSTGPSLKHIVTAHNNALIMKTRSAAAVMSGGCGNDLHTLAGHIVKSSKRNLLDEFDTHNLKLLLNVQS